MDILLSTPDYVVINKPAGIGMHQEADEPGIVRLLSEQLGEAVYPVHRLDKVTTGVLLLARQPQANRELSLQFAERKVGKCYLALSASKPSKKQGLIKGDMEKARGGSWKLSRSLLNPAITRFNSCLLGDALLGDRLLATPLRGFLLQPLTGKTHQLRVALKSQASPILGDARYGGMASDRVYLHAWQLRFSYQGEQICVRAPLNVGEHFLRHADQLTQWAESMLDTPRPSSTPSPTIAA
ncbi:TIGR01621 family pseudouridine synthase [Oceanisphaera sp. IT1-181]|uniref:TIGR01621 family pseudouridine synthase n=1 Tax=Oceanisphaera sp. IT1-181 TaxID=3081199 RepID=UPI0029CA019F|nr:TIGR01621 family pseudouridine synthase [Oceanisphaera sp. IT1-181]